MSKQHPQGFTFQKPTKKERNEESRRRQMPIDDYLTHIGFTSEQIAAMKSSGPLAGR
jgi:hypothetical protein